MDATAAALSANEAAAANLQDKVASVVRATSEAAAQQKQYDKAADIARADEHHRRVVADITDDTVGLRATAPVLPTGAEASSSSSTAPLVNASQALAPAIIYDSVEDNGDAHIAAAPCPDGPSVIVYQPTNRILSSIAGLFNCANLNGLPPTRRRRK